jgi:hypothetical protein
MLYINKINCLLVCLLAGTALQLTLSSCKSLLSQAISVNLLPTNGVHIILLIFTTKKYQQMISAAVGQRLATETKYVNCTNVQTPDQGRKEPLTIINR